MFDSVEAADIAAMPAVAAPAAAGTPLRAVTALTDKELLEQLATSAPSAAVSVTLDRIDVQSLDAHDRVVWLTLWERQRGWHDARMQHGLIAVGGPRPANRGPDGWSRDDDDWAREEIACALRLSTTTAGSRLDVARELTGRLADTRRALERGELTYLHARYLADSLATHPDPVALVVQQQALTGGHRDETLTNWRKRVDGDRR